jgi:hypothetical protein
MPNRKRISLDLSKSKSVRGSDQSGCIDPEKDAHTLVHSEDRSEGLFGVIQRSVTIVQNTNAVPQLGIIL